MRKEKWGPRLLRRARIATSAVIQAGVSFHGERLEIHKRKTRVSANIPVIHRWEGLQAVFPFVVQGQSSGAIQVKLPQRQHKPRLSKTRPNSAQLRFDFWPEESNGLAKATVSVSGSEIDLTSMTPEERLAVLRGLLQQRKSEEPEA